MTAKRARINSRSSGSAGSRSRAASPSAPAGSTGRHGSPRRANPRQLAYRFLARRAYTERELEARLRRHGVSDAEIAVTFDGLKRLGYLDDAATAAQWARSWRTYKGWGPIRVRAELVRRGLDRKLAEQVLADSFPDDATEAAALQAAARLTGRPAFSRAGRRQAQWLAAQLMRRGYSPGMVRRVVGRCCSRRDEDDMIDSHG